MYSEEAKRGGILNDEWLEGMLGVKQDGGGVRVGPEGRLELDQQELNSVYERAADMTNRNCDVLVQPDSWNYSDFNL